MGKILIIDDDKLSRSICIKGLSSQPYMIFEAENSAGAFAILEKESIDVILLSWEMPEMKGIELCKKIREIDEYKGIYIIFLTNKKDTKYLIQALEAGGDEYATKPMNPDEMIARINVGLRITNLEESIKREQMLSQKFANEMEKLADERARQLIHADKMVSLGELSAGIVHEINNPTTFVSGNIQIMERYIPEIKAFLASIPEDHPGKSDISSIVNEFEESLVGIKEGATRISKIVKDLKTFSYDGESQVSNFSVNDALSTALSLCRNALKYKTKTDISLEEDLPKVRGDIQKIEQIFVNLFINATDAMAHNTRDNILTIRSSKKDNNVVIIIEDNGPGIPEDILKKIWDPFFTTKPTGEGTGLGLAISKNIVEEHGGSIKVKNAPEGGASFEITLPSVPSQR